MIFPTIIMIFAALAALLPASLALPTKEAIATPPRVDPASLMGRTYVVQSHPSASSAPAAPIPTSGPLARGARFEVARRRREERRAAEKREEHIVDYLSHEGAPAASPSPPAAPAPAPPAVVKTGARHAKTKASNATESVHSHPAASTRASKSKGARVAKAHKGVRVARALAGSRRSNINFKR